MVEHHLDILLSHPKKGLDQIYSTMNEILVTESKINISTSGCAAISVFLYKNKIFAANVGDSRAISARKIPTQKKFQPL
jgi:serine/threonine protein phosphatase PrpC